VARPHYGDADRSVHSSATRWRLAHRNLAVIAYHRHYHLRAVYDDAVTLLYVV